MFRTWYVKTPGAGLQRLIDLALLIARFYCFMVFSRQNRTPTCAARLVCIGILVLFIMTDRIWHMYLAAQEIKDLWLEYEDCTSEEARVVKDFDKLEMIVQADEYERGEPQCKIQYAHGIIARRVGGSVL